MRERAHGTPSTSGVANGPGQESPRPRRQPYSPPVVEELGTFRDLTREGFTGSFDVQSPFGEFVAHDDFS